MTFRAMLLPAFGPGPLKALAKHPRNSLFTGWLPDQVVSSIFHRTSRNSIKTAETSMALSAVILNWKRPENVRLIVDSLKQLELIDDVIVWNNNPAAVFEQRDAKIVNASHDFGLYTRFAAVCLARHEAVLIQDDDLLLPQETVERLFETWHGNPATLHGIFGRAPRRDGSYGRRISKSGRAPIVLTRALITKRVYGADFFRYCTQFADLQQKGNPLGNGEDIIFSYVVMHESGKLNHIHRFPFTELPSPYAIHDRNWQEHRSHRTLIMEACEKWLHEAGIFPK